MMQPPTRFSSAATSMFGILIAASMIIVAYALHAYGVPIAWSVIISICSGAYGGWILASLLSRIG